MTEEELYYTLALCKVEGVGCIMGRRLIDYFGSAKEVLSASPKELIQVSNVGTILLEKLSKKNIYEKAEAELKHIQVNHLSPIYYKATHFPFLLNQCVDAPILMFSSVPSIDWTNRKVISIIGTRYPSSRGITFCKTLIEDLKVYNPIIVSGLAYGIDVSAHQAALNHGLTTFAVLGNPLNTVYPESHFRIAQAMEQQGGGLLSEFWISDRIERENFIQRNRIVAGLSQATIVIESAIKGGSMSTVTFANDYNRDVFAVPGRTDDATSAGCNELIRTNRAQLLTSAANIVETLNWDRVEQKKKVIQPELFVDLSGDEEKVYNYLKENSRDLLDLIALGVELPIYKVSSTLLNLELKGLVRPLPGKYFELL